MKILKWLLILVMGLFIAGYAINKQLESRIDQPIKPSNHYKEGRFENMVPIAPPTTGKTMRIAGRWFTEQRIDDEPTKPLPIKAVSRAQLDQLNDEQIHLIKLGHSSILLKVYGSYWLIDPVFSERASPFGFMGPKRFHPTPISITQLPPIDKVFISHNHYDHLDKAAIQQLALKTKQFLVPLGVDSDLRRWGVEPARIKHFDWWQEYKADNALLVFTPTQHFSGRGLGDRDTTLWGSWVIKTAQQSLYFSGDSGYFDGFKIIGEKYGPFDLTMIETGAYNEDWPDHHMTPEQSVQAHIDLKGKTMLPIHNGTFDLAFHPWYEPLERVTAAAEKQQVQLITPIVGEIFTANQTPITEQWWRKLK